MTDRKGVHVKDRKEVPESLRQEWIEWRKKQNAIPDEPYGVVKNYYGWTAEAVAAERKKEDVERERNQAWLKTKPDWWTFGEGTEGWTCVLCGYEFPPKFEDDIRERGANAESYRNSEYFQYCDKHEIDEYQAWMYNKKNEIDAQLAGKAPKSEKCPDCKKIIYGYTSKHFEFQLVQHRGSKNCRKGSAGIRSEECPDCGRIITGNTDMHFEYAMSQHRGSKFCIQNIRDKEKNKEKLTICPICDEPFGDASVNYRGSVICTNCFSKKAK